MVLMVLVVHAILLPALFVSVIYVIQESYESHFINQVRSDSYLYARLLGRSQDKSFANLQQLLDDSLLSGRVVFARLVTPNKTFTGKNGLPSASFKEDFFFNQHPDHTYFISLPVYDANEKQRATLELGYDEQPVLDQIAQIYRRGIYISVTYIILTLLMVIVIAPMLTRSLQKLRETADIIADGHLDKEIELDYGFDEIEGLAYDLERMRRELFNRSQALEYQAHHDHLTGLANRVQLQGHVTTAIAASQRNQTVFALFLMDLDNFKEVNDTLGHIAGDTVLQCVSARLKGALRKSDTVARLGGDEFAMILPLTNPDDYKVSVKKIHNALQDPIDVENQTLHVSGSLGIALYPDHGSDYGTLLRHADLAMYASKRCGDPFTIYRSGLDKETTDKLFLGEELHQAIEQNDLVLHYQPKLDLKSGKIYCAEALVRWQHPKRGLLSSDQFIPLAERTGLIKPLTEWVLQSALQQCRAWIDSGTLVQVALNISPTNLQDNQLPKKINDSLHMFDLPSSVLQIEITENAIFTDPLRAMKILEMIDAMGVSISIDDFGTGYSSLAQLMQMPLSEIKIDKSFVFEMANEKNAVTIVRATIDLAHNLGLLVVAEGVEQEEILDQLVELGCDLAQGYYISRPLTQEQLSHFLVQRQFDQGQN